MGILHNFLYIEQITNGFMIVELIIICRRPFINDSLNCPISVFPQESGGSRGGFFPASFTMREHHNKEPQAWSVTGHVFFFFQSANNIS